MSSRFLSVFSRGAVKSSVCFVFGLYGGGLLSRLSICKVFALQPARGQTEVQTSMCYVCTADRAVCVSVSVCVC